MKKNSYRERFLGTWKKSKDKFIKPKLHWYFGSWKKEGNLPVWRRGPIIYWAKYGEYDSNWNYAKLEDSWWTEKGKQNHPILSKIIKHPLWPLPYWLSFYCFNHDIMYKTKWSETDFRYEYPTHFTLVFFGLCISVTAYIPKVDDKDWLADDQYWESLLTYQYFNGDLEKTNNTCGWYNNPGEPGFRFQFDPRFLKNTDDRNYLIALQKEKYVDILKQYKEEKEQYEKEKRYAVYCDIRSNENKADWRVAVFNKKPLIYLTKEDCDKAIANLKSGSKFKENGIEKTVIFKPYIGATYNSIFKNFYNIRKSNIIDSSIDMLENIVEN